MSQPLQWILNSTIGKLKVLYYPYSLPDIANPQLAPATTSIQQYWEIGETKECSMCSCPIANTSQVTLTNATCDTFYLIGKSGQQYEVYKNGGSLSLRVSGNTILLWNNAVSAINVPEFYYDGQHLGLKQGGTYIYPSSTNSYDLAATQVTANSPGYIVATAKARLGGGFSISYADIRTTNALWGALVDIFIGGKAVGTDPYDNLPTGGDEPIPGGGAVSEPGLPGLSAASTGIMGLFCPTAAQMQQLADFMWTDFGGQGTTVIEVLEEIVEAIKRAISNPLDYILGLNIIPSQGLSVGGSKVVKFGFVSSGVSMPVLSNHYFIVDCGSVSFDVLCGDSFLDYAPYSKFSIYLPYIGFKDIDPNDCVGHTISVKYHGDAITGGLTAYVFKDGNVMYQYSGGCALNVPLSADNWGATIASAASIATGVIAAAATGGAAGVGAAAAKGAASVAANPSLLSPQVMHSGAVSGAPGFMGVQYPFIIREAVNFHSTDGFNKESGYPAYYYKMLSDVTGFTTILDPHINNIPQATQGEMAEIISLLESGVIL